ncbi:GNAT family N-acetyltransferase [Streptomyces sp. NPDC006879]|uniref:GNAT family N-acetyltransferase n=1 Tax=Streptomyces sp. NPDC006879 TaxID=3364767 RepID=UPI0036B960DE
MPSVETEADQCTTSQTSRPRADCEDTLDLRIPAELLELCTQGPPTALGDGLGHPAPGRLPQPDGAGLLDRPASWGPTTTPAGRFQLVPLRPGKDLGRLVRWMNDPAVAAFWELSGPESVTAAHVRAQLDGDGRSFPCLGTLDGRPMSYWEIYRADLDPISRFYPARPHDTGIHLLIGEAADRGRGVGTILLRTVADLILDHRPRCNRVIAEPDIRNTSSVSAFLGSGFRLAGEVELPNKRCALLIRERALRNLL